MACFILEIDPELAGLLGAKKPPHLSLEDWAREALALGLEALAAQGCADPECHPEPEPSDCGR